MNILITGNMGYVGSFLVKHLKQNLPNINIVGFDMGYFKDSLTNTVRAPENMLDHQYYGDLRNFNSEILNSIDSVISLAAISNDPMGKKYTKVTKEINFNSTVKLAKLAKEKRVKSFIFASSCSIYGNGTSDSRTELSRINPLTEYAKSKVNSELKLNELADTDFNITNLRFATACGMSDRLRLDLVLNDFIASAHTKNQIDILSDGTPFRPLINVRDMARAIQWAIIRDKSEGGEFLSVNVGKNENNYQIKELAEAVKQNLNNIEVNINHDAIPDKRSYKVSFDLFETLASKYVPQISLEETIQEVKSALLDMNFTDINFRNSELIRLKKLTNLQTQNQLNENLEWIN